MSSRAISLKLEPAAAPGLEINSYTHSALVAEMHDEMCESVYLDVDSTHVRCSVHITPDEARVLANQLLQVADEAEDARDRRVAFEHIQDELRDADEHGGPCCLYAHPDVHYVPAGEIAAKVRDLDAGGRRRYIVLERAAAPATPSAEVAA